MKLKIKNFLSWPNRQGKLKILSLLALILAACTPARPPIPTLTPGATRTPSPSSPPNPPLTVTRSPAPSPTPTGTLVPALQVCSPLAGYSLDQIPAMVTNPYHPPPPGSDMPHEGADISVLQAGTRVALAGSPVQAALDGVVAAAIQDRFPYGNALMIETPLEELPPAWLVRLQAPTLAPTLPFNGPLTCPKVDLHLALDRERRSLYLVYAHMQSAPALHPGDQVSCGQPLGKIGATGNALNPHLHLEARVGPGGARFASLSHYDASATPAEMAAYCTWRVSNLFQFVDPLRVIGNR